MGPLERLRRRLFALARPPRREAFGDRARRMLPPESSQAGESRWLHTWLWLLRLGGIAVVGLNMVTGFLFAGLGSLQNPVMALGIFLIFLSQLGILADLWQSGPLRQQVGSMVVLLAGLYVAESARPGIADATGAWWPMLFLISGVIYGVGRFTGVLRVAALAALVAVHASMRLWDWRHAPSPFAHDLMDRYATELGQLLVIAVCVAIGMWVGIRGAITVDLGLERERRRHEEEAEVGRAVFEQREADRFIHDAVLHTLR
ncbi:MAG TPA: hypothetical protein GX743_01505, partial [Actinomycetales bacterium]|nr:hypothetical protein [Actinomycetales bacterium]